MLVHTIKDGRWIPVVIDGSAKGDSLSLEIDDFPFHVVFKRQGDHVPMTGGIDGGIDRGEVTTG